jgi:hypothetical protein
MLLLMLFYKHKFSDDGQNLIIYYVLGRQIYSVEAISYNFKNYQLIHQRKVEKIQLEKLEKTVNIIKNVEFIITSIIIPIATIIFIIYLFI